MNFLLSLINADKLAGYVRAGVSAAFVMAVKHYAGLSTYLTPDVEAAVDVVATTVVVGAWSHIAKVLKQPKAAA